MKDGDSVTNYCARIMRIENIMQFHVENMEVEKILRSSVPKFNYIVCSTKETKDVDAFLMNFSLLFM